MSVLISIWGHFLYESFAKPTRMYASLINHINAADVTNQTKDRISK